MAGLCHKQLRCVRNVAPARHRPVALAVPARARTWRGVCHVAQAVEAPAHNVSKVAALTEALMIEEANLAQMFESGRPMPRAGIVNAAREKIASLKAELAALIQGVEPPSRNAPTAMTHISATVQPLMDVEDVEMIEKARLLLDGVTTRRDPNWVHISDSEVPVQLCILEAENQRLRKVATALIRRQQQLEELVAGLLAPIE